MKAKISIIAEFPSGKAAANFDADVSWLPLDYRDAMPSGLPRRVLEIQITDGKRIFGQVLPLPNDAASKR